MYGLRYCLRKPDKTINNELIALKMIENNCIIILNYVFYCKIILKNNEQGLKE